MILKRSLTKWSQVISRNISYVQRARLLEKIKNDDDFCTQSLETGKFLLYNKGGGGSWWSLHLIDFKESFSFFGPHCCRDPRIHPCVQASPC